MAADRDYLIETADLLKGYLGGRLEEITVERAVFGLFFSGIKLSSGEGGLCFTPIKEIPEAVCCPSSARAMPLSGRLSGRTVSQYLDDLSSDNVLKRTLAVAALNALSSLYWSDAGAKTLGGQGYEMREGVDAFDAVEIEPGSETVVIGALVPMLHRLKAGNCAYMVVEMDSRTLKGDELDHYLPPERAGEVLPQAKQVVITGVTLLNKTLSGLLSQCAPDARVLVTGPTASMIPDVLFEAGVSMLGGTVVNDADAALDMIAEGGSGYHLFGKSCERMVVSC